MGIRAEVRVKYQKNGNVHHYTYYRCTRKSRTHKCAEAPVRSELLDTQLSGLLAEYAMPSEWIAPLSIMLDKEAADAVKTASGAVQGLRERVAEYSRNLARLTDVYVAQDIERDDYLERRRSLLSEKKSVEEQIPPLLPPPSPLHSRSSAQQSKTSPFCPFFRGRSEAPPNDLPQFRTLRLLVG